MEEEKEMRRGERERGREACCLTTTLYRNFAHF
jgi:hypothetical protein